MDPKGLAYATAAYAMWGVLPLYWRLLHAVPPLTVLANRVVWTAIAASLVLAKRGAFGELLAIVRDRRRLVLATAGTVLIASNWYCFIWGIAAGRTVECSLGYFLSPLFNVVLGLGVLRERITRLQVAAVALATVGVAWLAVGHGHVPWLGLALAFSFGFYGLFRKLAKIASLPGLAFETVALAPLALAWAHEVPLEARTPVVFALLVGAGAMTALPLLWFNEAAQRLPLTVLGVLQYLAPTGQFLVGTLVFHEPFTREKLIAFGFIWVGLALYTADALRSWRASTAR